MANVPSMYMRYFVYSEEEAALMTRVHGSSASTGMVVVRGIERPYTSIVRDPKETKPDAIVVLKGDIRKIKYREPSK